MKSIWIILAFLSSSVVFGQHDLSFWARRFDGAVAVTPWYMYSGGPVAFDMRYNFDHAKSFGMFAGKSFSKHSVTLIPLLGFISGNGYNAVSPEVYITLERGKIDFWSLSQYSRGLKSNPNMLYNWLDIKYGINKWFAIGVGEQFFKRYEPGSSGQLDLGPSFGITHGGIYVVIWPTISLGPGNKYKSSLIAGAGYIWSKP